MTSPASWHRAYWPLVLLPVEPEPPAEPEPLVDPIEPLVEPELPVVPPAPPAAPEPLVDSIEPPAEPEPLVELMAPVVPAPEPASLPVAEPLMSELVLIESELMLVVDSVLELPPAPLASPLLVLFLDSQALSSAAPSARVARNVGVFLVNIVVKG